MKNSEKFWLSVLILTLIGLWVVHPVLFAMPLILYLILCILDRGINFMFSGGRYNVINIIERLIIKFNNFLDK